VEDAFLTALGPAELADLLARGTERTFARGRPLMHEGQVPDRVLLLREGTVKVFATTPTGKEVILAVRGPGELVGELAALAGAERSASVVAIERVRAVVIRQDAFQAFLLAQPAAALTLLGVLAGRLRDADAKRAELAGLNGASLESVARALQTMRSLHWIETGRREVRILDVEALRRAAT
jgi:CRP/FNR family cyclic AMP-dependent transcriptional regulator